MSVRDGGPANVSTVIMRYRLLTGLAVAPLTLVMLTAEPAGAVDDRAAAVSEPAKQAVDPVGMLAGGMVLAASAAFAGTGMVRRRKPR
ncbi:hypothetical protein Caci_7504 [Catenulispora acidiphila DSM 44928]|uniref:Uncharacterized protein n=2 Tax=Catenulispora TaxID=414878 RepID=C7QB38_CATAD|nr:hypothetical protein Caci_7504 [Catenulispora acidiphila DSM 44928]